MKTLPGGGVALQKPKDLYGFTLDGVTFKRTTQLHEVGRYEVTDQDGGQWLVTGTGSNRYPWTCTIANDEERPNTVLHHGANLIDACRFISQWRARHPRSAYKK